MITFWGEGGGLFNPESPLAQSKLRTKPAMSQSFL